MSTKLEITARILLAVGMLAIVTAASANTVATFADPAPDGATPLFTLAGASFTGGWSGTGLTLEVPFTGQSWNDATFTLTPLTLIGPGQLSAGTLEFFKSVPDGGGQILKIDFDFAGLALFGFGASDVFGQAVTISGPGLPIGLTDETFAFSFANPVPTSNGYTFTAAFTSSAIPEPTGLALLGLGVCGLLRRR